MLTTFEEDITLPASEVNSDTRYRARVRHQDNTGRWSHWSAPIKFIATIPDISVLQENLIISEIMYNPASGQDQDGLSALLDYALGTSDEEFQGGVLEVNRVGGQATLGFPRNLLADDIVFVVESSVDLENWEVNTTLASQTETSVLYVTEFDEPSDRVFFRLNVV